MQTGTPKYLTDENPWTKRLPELLRGIAVWEIPIVVTKEIINAGVKGSCSHCPVAIAIDNAIKPFFDLDEKSKASDFRIAINRQYGPLSNSITKFNDFVNWKNRGVAVTSAHASILLTRNESVPTWGHVIQKVASFRCHTGDHIKEFVARFDSGNCVTPFRINLTFYLVSYMSEDGTMCKYTAAEDPTVSGLDENVSYRKGYDYEELK